MRIVPAVDDAANRSLIQPAGLDDVLKRESVSGHQATEIRGHGGRIAFRAGNSR
jgi:hypothetical protein